MVRSLHSESHSPSRGKDVNKAAFKGISGEFEKKLSDRQREEEERARLAELASRSTVSSEEQR